MAPSPSRPVSPPLSPPLPRDDKSRRQGPAGPKHILLPKYSGNERMWCEWCEKDLCANLEYEDTVMECECYSSFMNDLNLSYFENLKAKCPSADKELTPKRYVQKIRFWHYKRYAHMNGFPWGHGNYSELLNCFLAKIRMTFRQPAKNLTLWIKEPFLYSISDDSDAYDPVGVPSTTVLGKRNAEV